MAAERLSSYNMKRSITAVLKRQMETMPLSKITISALTKECGINRKTFYYHFQDIYQAAEWLFDQEIGQFFRELTIVNYHEALRTTLQYVDQNEALIAGTLKSFGRDYLYRIFQPSVRAAVVSLFQDIYDSAPVNLEYLDFLEDFYTDALICMVLNWIEKGQKTDIDTLIQYVDYTVRGNIKSALLREMGAEQIPERSDKGSK